MNIVDLIILLIIGVSTVIGLYNGFVVSLLNAASFIVSWIVSLISYPLLTKLIISKFPTLLKTISYYADGSSKLPDVADRTSSITFYTKDRLADLISGINLPNPFNKVLVSNVFKAADDVKTLGEYFDMTIASVIINILSFLLLFFVLKLLFIAAVSILKAVVSLPVLKQFDGLAGAGFGVLRGFFILYFLFALIPILMTLAPVEVIHEYLDGSLLAGLFYKFNMFTNFISGRIL